MDNLLFDDFTRTLSRKLERRGALRLAGAALGAFGLATLLPAAAAAKETPAFQLSYQTLTVEGKRGRHRKKKKTRKFLAQCTAEAGAMETECGSFCYANYGFNTDFFLACSAQCVTCVPYLYACAYEEATNCFTAFDAVW